jgi:hypothetical protein
MTDINEPVVRAKRLGQLERRALRKLIINIPSHLLRQHGPLRERTRCGARTRDGSPCEARGIVPNGRCRWHGGLSTGPKTPEGKRRALANLWWQAGR